MQRSIPLPLLALAFLAVVLPLAAQAAPPSASLSVSRISGKAPLMVYFDAVGTTDPDVSNPIHSLTYCFDAGDGNAEKYTLAGHKTTNKARFCGAPQWAYVYESPGTHTMTLTVIDEDGNTDQTSVNITVNDYLGSETECVSTNGAFAGCPGGAVQTISSDFDSAISSAIAAGRKRVLFRCSQNFAVSSTVFVGDGVHIGAYDNNGRVTNRRCQYNVTTGTPNLLFDVTGDDNRINDGTWTGSQGSNFVRGDAVFGDDTDHLLIQNWTVNLTQFVMSIGPEQQGGSQLPRYIGFFSNQFTDCGNNGGGKYCIYSAIEFFAIVDTVLSDARDGEHVVRLVHGEDVFVHNSKFELAKAGKTLFTARAEAWNGSAQSGLLNRYGENVFISDSWFKGNVAWPFQMGAANNSAATIRTRNYIVERNYFTALDPNVQVIAMLQEGGNGSISTDYTFRNNVCDMTNSATFARCLGASSVVPNFLIQNNTMFSPGGGRQFMSGGSGTGCEVKNNLSWDGSGANETGSGCSNTAGNADTDGGEPGVADLTVCPFVSCNNPTLAELAASTGNLEVVDQGVPVPYRCDYAQTDMPQGARDIGAYEQGSATFFCFAAASGLPPATALRIIGVTP